MASRVQRGDRSRFRSSQSDLRAKPIGTPIGVPIAAPASIPSSGEKKDNNVEGPISETSETNQSGAISSSEGLEEVNQSAPSPSSFAPGVTRQATPGRTAPRLVEPRPLPIRLTPGASLSASNNGRASRSSVTPSRSTQSYAVTPSRIPPSTVSGSSRREPSASPSLRDHTPAPSFAVPVTQRESRTEDESLAKPSLPSSTLQATKKRRASVDPAASARSMSVAGRMQAPRGSKPSPPLSAYRLFSAKVRHEFEKDAATATGARYNVNHAVLSAWKGLDSAERQPYEDESSARRKEYEASMEAWREIYGERNGQNESTEADMFSQPSNLRDKPSRPQNAYLLFKKDFESRSPQLAGKKVRGNVSTAWHALDEMERSVYQSKANEARKAFEVELAEWQRANPEAAAADEGKDGEGVRTDKKNKRPKKRTISDDEAEYLAEIEEHGEGLLNRRLDDLTTTMAEISEKTYNKGRASQKTFELERKFRHQKREREQIRQRMRRRNVRTEEELYALEGRPSTDAFLATVKGPQSVGTSEVDTDGNATATEGEDDAGEENDGHSDAESLGAASTSTHHTLREKKFSIQTRIVDGRIVLDETSLQHSQNDEAGALGANTEFVEVNESDRFVNSATHAKRRGRNDRWQPAETEQFLRAVSMWGSDFEMIARMFPLRDRSQIRAKWRSMEKTDGHSLDLAFKTRLPVDLDSYGAIAGVDLSGDAPIIEVPSLPMIKKAEEEEEDGEEDDRFACQETVDLLSSKREVEVDENGLEIVEEGDEDTDLPAIPSSRSPWNQERRPAPMGPPAGPVAPAEQTILGEASTSKPVRKGRSDSAPKEVMTGAGRRARSSSTASHAGTSTSTTNAQGAHGASSAAASDRERKQKRLMDEERKKREQARRRPLPEGEEEIVDE